MVYFINRGAKLQMFTGVYRVSIGFPAISMEKDCTNCKETICVRLKVKDCVCCRESPKIQQTRMLVTCQRFGDLFLFGQIWQYSSNHKTYNIGRLKVY